MRNNNVSEIIDFYDIINLKDCIDDEGTTTLIMLATELGNTDIVRTLLESDYSHGIQEKHIDYNNENTGIQKLLNMALAN